LLEKTEDNGEVLAKREAQVDELEDKLKSISMQLNNAESQA